jgi:RNA polymerase primary sigma factor
MSSHRFPFYLNSIAKVPLLTHQQEIHLGNIIRVFSKFSVDDVRDVEALVDKLTKQSDPVSAFVWERLPAQDRKVLAHYQIEAETPTNKTALTCRSIIFQVMHEAKGPITIQEACEAAKPRLKQMGAKGKSPLASFKSKFCIAAKKSELVRIERGFSLPPTTPAVASYASSPSSNQACRTIVQALNSIIGEQCIYEPERFQGVALRPETSDQIKHGATVPNRVSLNRMLIEDAYPLELLKNQKNQEAVRAAVIELVGANLRLVVKAASNYRNSYLDIEELTFEGNLGLITAAERFDPGKGCRFSTYATWWIQQYIRLAVNRAHTIRTPIRREAQIAKIQSATSFDPDIEDQDTAKISMETDIKEADVKKLLKIRMKLLPLDAPIADSDDCFSLQSIIPSNELAADTLLIFSEREEKLKELLERLPENIQKIVKLRFGLGDGQPQTLEEIAVVQGVTRERIRQMQQQGLRFLQLEIQKLGYAIPPDAILKDPKAPIPKKCQEEEIYKKPMKKALKNSPPEAATSLKAA